MEPSPAEPPRLPDIVEGSDGRSRCYWVGQHADYTAYHDREWGVPVDDDRTLFEKICLEGFQSGLSWLTILRKRENFRVAFEGFEIERVAGFRERDVQRLLRDPGIVRHRGKIEAAINNARRALELASAYGSLAAFFWQWEPDGASRPGTIDRAALTALSRSPESVSMAKELKRHGWMFVGPTTAYAFMQAMGLVNDHIEGCWARPVIERRRLRFKRPVESTRRPRGPAPTASR